MSYEIITPNGKDLYLRVHIDTEDTLKNRKIVHKIRELCEKLTSFKSTKKVSK